MLLAGAAFLSCLWAVLSVSSLLLVIALQLERSVQQLLHRQAPFEGEAARASLASDSTSIEYNDRASFKHKENERVVMPCYADLLWSTCKLVVGEYDTACPTSHVATGFFIFISQERWKQDLEVVAVPEMM